MVYAKRRYKQYKRNPLVRFGKYASRGAGAVSGAALGFIRGNVPGAVAGYGTGYAAGNAFYKRNSLKKRDFRMKLRSNNHRYSGIGKKETGSNRGPVLGSPWGPRPPVETPPSKKKKTGLPHRHLLPFWGRTAYKHRY